MKLMLSSGDRMLSSLSLGTEPLSNMLEQA